MAATDMAPESAGIIKKYSDLKILRQILHHITAAGRTAGVEKKSGRFFLFLNVFDQFIKLFLVVSFIQCL